MKIYIPLHYCRTFHILRIEGDLEMRFAGKVLIRSHNTKYLIFKYVGFPTMKLVMIFLPHSCYRNREIF